MPERRSPDRLSAKIAAIDTAVLFLRLLSLCGVGAFVFAASTFAAADLRPWQFHLLWVVVTIGAWLLLEHFTDWRNNLFDLAGLRDSFGEHVFFPVARIMLPLAFILGLFVAAVSIVPGVLASSSARAAKAVAASGYTVPLADMGAAGTASLPPELLADWFPTFEQDGRKYYVAGGLLRHGRQDKYSAALQDAALKLYRKQLDAEYIPLLSKTLKANASISLPAGQTGVLAAPAKMCAYAAMDEASRNRAGLSWRYIDLQLSLVDLAARNEKTIDIQLALLMAHNAAVSAGKVLASGKGLAFPVQLRQKLEALLDRNFAARALRYEWSSRLAGPARFGAPTPGIPAFIDARFWVPLRRTAMISPQLRFDDAIKGGMREADYLRIASLAADVDSAAARLNRSPVQVSWSNWSSIPYIELLLRDNVKLALAFNAIHSFRRDRRRLPETLAGIPEKYLPREQRLSSITGAPLGYALLPGGGFRVFVDVPQGLQPLAGGPEISLSE